MRALLFKILFTCSLLFSSLLSANSSLKCVISQDETMIKICQELADKGDAKAQNTLGLIYLETAPMVNGNHTKARLLFKKAAEQGLADAQYNLGAMYRDDFNNFVLALKWFEKAAIQGHAEAQNSMGFIYEHGARGEPPRDYNFDETGTTQDPELDYYLTQNDKIPSQIPKKWRRLYPLTEFGRGVPQDYVKAAEWYQKAADQNLALAQHNLGFLYLQGFGVPLDEEKGFELTKKAADQDFVPALNMLSFLYAQGFGVEKDGVKSVEYAIRSNKLYPRYAIPIRQLVGKYIEPINPKLAEEYIKQIRDEDLGPVLKLKTEQSQNEYLNNLNDEEKVVHIFNRYQYITAFYNQNYHRNITAFDLFPYRLNYFDPIPAQTKSRRFEHVLLKKAYQGYDNTILMMPDLFIGDFARDHLPIDKNIIEYWKNVAANLAQGEEKDYWIGIDERFKNIEQGNHKPKPGDLW